MMRKTAIITTGVVLGASLLAGCGSDGKKGDAGSYCDNLKTAAADISTFTGSAASPDFSKLKTVSDEIKKVAASAPDSVAADWKMLSDGLGGLVSALDDAGITLEQLITAASTGQLPPGVTAEQMTDLSTKISALQADTFTKASKNINANAKSECGIDLEKVN